MPTAAEIAQAVWDHQTHGVGSDTRVQAAWRWLSSAVHDVEGLTATVQALDTSPDPAAIAAALTGPLTEALAAHVSDPAGVADAVVAKLAQKLS